ncbi:hypothetical protein ACKX2L_06125 [Lachnospiraceae bacterium YH-ros2228]
MAYRLTEKGKEYVKTWIAGLEEKRKEILDAGLDTCEETALPDVEAIEDDVNLFADKDGYLNGWGVTDSTDYDEPIQLEEGVDYIDEDYER